MLIETSVVVSILKREPGHEQLMQRIAEVESAEMSTVSYLEAAMVMGDRHAVSSFLEVAEITLVDFTSSMANRAAEAFEKYGKGNHPAALNFGDCIVYATAKELSTPLLFLGQDFSQTDIPQAPSIDGL